MAFLVGVSGVIGSGKDYLTDKLIEELTTRGRTIAQTSFAKPLKKELGDIIDLLKDEREHSHHDLAVHLSDSVDNMSVEQAGWLVERLHPELDIPDLNGWSRSLGVRSCLQVLGTDIRRAQEPSYWTDIFLEEVNSLETDYVFVSDGRFPNEMDCVIDNGGVTFRMDVSEEILNHRRMSRDGIAYTEEQLNHTSETALNDYKRFDYYVGEVVEADFLSDIIEMRYRLR